jgi:hypothetical protein
MSFSYTTTQTFTRTSAKRVAAKVKGDLSYMQILYGRPDDEDIEAYEEEVVELLAGGYLAEVCYGFKKAGNWVTALRYVADLYGNLTGDDAVGKLDRNVDVSGASFHSFLRYSPKWAELTPTGRETIKARLTIKRSEGTEPGTEGGYWTQDKTYSADGGGVRRSTFRRYG